jgi:hypothetical protein
MGGPSRELQPSALMLHSGDVLVLAGPARGCFHGEPRACEAGGLVERSCALVAGHQRPHAAPAGVPRVLSDQGLPPQLLEAGGAGEVEEQQQQGGQQQQEGEQQEHPVLRHLRGMRVNISIRAVR